MGHVDHGKTSLLDVIRTANVAGREAGGITQHIGAYQVEMKGRKIVFIDTPGHEAFTRMRSRGAKVTDIVILVVAAEDGVMPPDSSKRSITPKQPRCRSSTAINKIDKPECPARAHQTAILRSRSRSPEDWGGDTDDGAALGAHAGRDSALAGKHPAGGRHPGPEGQARTVQPWVPSSKRSWIAVSGPVATVLVRNGTLSRNVGDFFICGAVFGKVRAMQNDRGAQVRKAEPSMPVEVLGLESLPEAGDDFQVVTDTAKAKQIVSFRDQRLKEAALAKSSRITLEQLHKQMKAGEVKETAHHHLQTDVGGSAEVLTETLTKLSNDKVRVRVIHSGVGAINESDVLLASASNAIVIGFNVRPERNAMATAEQEKVEVRLHRYHLQA